MRRDDDARDLQQVERGGQEHRAGGAVGDEREVARVDAVAHGDVGDLLGDVGDRDAVGERRRAARARAACRAPRTRCRASSGSRRISPPAKPSGSRMPISRQASVSVGARAAAPVARRAGVRARALGPDADVARRRDRDDAAAAGADARDLGRQRVDDQVVLELEGVVDERRAVDDERDVGRGAADVGAEQVAGRRARRRGACSRSCRRPGRRRRSGTASPAPRRQGSSVAAQSAKFRSPVEAELAQVGVEAASSSARR